MKNVMQLKAIIKNIAKEKSISAQLVMQNFMTEKTNTDICKTNPILSFRRNGMMGYDR